jgi:hypothetical protein
MIERLLLENVRARLNQGKAIIIAGGRQVGKTTLLKMLFPGKTEALWLNGDEPDVQKLFENISSTRLRALIGNTKNLIIDEAQRIPEIGLRMKLITDEVRDVQLIASGSSAFELAGKVNEPLTGRKWEFKLFPISFSEMVLSHGLLEERRLMPHRLVYGYYPDIINNQGDEKERLRQLTDSFLYKDLLLLDQIKKPERLMKLLQALAYQIGSQVSYNELSQVCGLDPKTVEKYVMLLEQTYIIFRLNSFSRNLRNELKSSRKIYFFDNGVRNAIISNFSNAESRNDTGQLWENFLLSERIKFLNNSLFHRNLWFWRTVDQREIDLVEDNEGKISIFEFKWNPEAKVKTPKLFLTNYPGASFSVIHPDNFDEFLM